jgi:predicted nucleic acid-binding protein
MRWILDAGLLVAFMVKDAHHAWAVSLWNRAPAPLLTCEAVLTEAAFLVQSRGDLPAWHVSEFVRRGVVRVIPVMAEHSETVHRLLAKYADTGMQLADACCVALAEQFHDSPVWTLDKADFRIYRKHGRQAIPLIAPPD